MELGQPVVVKAGQLPLGRCATVAGMALMAVGMLFVTVFSTRKHSVAAPPLVSLAGAACTDEDFRGVLSYPNGTSAASFGYMLNTCGHVSYSIWSGLDKAHVTECIVQLVAEKGIAFSQSCANCYLEQVQYAVDNCKFACLFSWCSSGCFKCMHDSVPILSACVGREILHIKPC
mmetsp:Transcript_95680/g.256940  ORF Transcript_95680/g.256940 Transcript_95680/m.256940 type:complete len:174 (-) Transcript_95680:137-658(-)